MKNVENKIFDTTPTFLSYKLLLPHKIKIKYSKGVIYYKNGATVFQNNK